MLDNIITAGSIIIVALVLGFALLMVLSSTVATVIIFGIFPGAVLVHGATVWLWLRFVEVKKAPTWDRYWTEFNRSY